MAMRGIWTQHDHAVRWDGIASQFVVSDSLTREDAGWWIEAERFLQDHAHVGKVSDIIDRWETPSEHLVELVIKPMLNIGMLGEEVPCPCQGVGGSLVTSSQ